MQIHLYEVIRVIDNIPLFLEDHLERLYHSANLSNILNLPKSEILEEKISELISVKNRDTGNIKLSFIINNQDVLPVPELEFIPHAYPSPAGAGNQNNFAFDVKDRFHVISSCLKLHIQR